MSVSIKLPQKPAFARATKSVVFVSTYQLEGPDSRSGSIYVLSHNLNIIECIKAPAGIFRFDFLKKDVIIAAVTNGSLLVTTLSDAPSTECIRVTEDILLDVSSPDPASNVACTDKTGCTHIVDVDTGTVVATWKAHTLSQINAGCEVWTCCLNGSLLCTGGEDATLKVWDARTQSMVQRLTGFGAGVTFSKWQEENVILSGSYDQHIRIFDIRKSKEPLKESETSGGVWYVEQFQQAEEQRYVAACMYGGWRVLDASFELIEKDEEVGKELLYGVSMASENLLICTTFNDYKVTAVTV